MVNVLCAIDQMSSFMCMYILFLLVIVLSVLLQFTESVWYLQTLPLSTFSTLITNRKAVFGCTIYFLLIVKTNVNSFDNLRVLGL